MINCGMDIRVKDSEHDVNVGDSEQKVTVQTTLDKILEVCEIVLANGTVVPYSKWTEAQFECLTTLDPGNALGIGDLFQGELPKLPNGGEG